MYDVITIGSATRDVFVRSKALQLHRAKDVPGLIEACFPFGAKINVEEIVFETGGGATNNAATFARMAKWKTATVCRIGEDSSGEDIMRALERDRVAPRFVQRAAGEQTAYSTILLSGVSERTILTYRGASSCIEHRRIPWSAMRAKLFYVSSLSGDLMLLSRTLAHAKRSGAKVFMNPGGGELKHGAKLIPLLRRLDLVIMNREEAARLTGKKLPDTRGLVAALRTLVPHAVMTDGPQGAYAITQPATYFAPVLPARTVNLTGAGDAFGSAFAVGLMRWRDVGKALALGTVNATSVVQHTGAKVGILERLPSGGELNKVKIKKLSY